MEMNPSEVFDKWSILQMKTRFELGLQDTYFRYCSEVHVLLYQIVAGGRASRPVIELDILTSIAKLIEANSKIWLLEATIRNEYPRDPANRGKEPDLAEIGRAALLIREINGMRIQAKNEIDSYFGVEPERKAEHASKDAIDFIRQHRMGDFE